MKTQNDIFNSASAAATAAADAKDGATALRLKADAAGVIPPEDFDDWCQYYDSELQRIKSMRAQPSKSAKAAAAAPAAPAGA